MRHLSRTAIFLAVFTIAMTQQAWSGEADVASVEISQSSDGSYIFDVTVRHADEGWDHYADKWEVVGPDGTVYAERILAHPHVDEQPFTRSLSGIQIPEDVREVTVRARDKLHGFGGAEFAVALKGSL